MIGSVRDLQRHCCDLARRTHPDLDWAEFGVSRGLSARFLLTCLARERRLYLFDSWEGLPEPWEDVDRGRYRAAVPSFEDGRAHLIKGLFGETLPSWVPTQASPLGFVHMDADLYSSTRFALDAISSLIVPGTVILFDEYYNYPGWQNHEYKAFREFIEATGRRFAYLGKSDKHRAFPEREHASSAFVRVAVQILE